MARKRTDTPARNIAIEICRSTLRFVAIEELPDSPSEQASASLDSADSEPAHRPAEVKVSSMTWRKQAGTLHSPMGLQELTAAFRQLVHEEKLGNARVRVSLNGDFCVTRVLAGTNERVREEMRELEQRSQHYLRLGAGVKMLADSSRQIDARHQHALLTVTNQKTIDTIVEAAAAAGLPLSRVEPSLVALCRTAGRLGYDASEPVMLVNVDEQGVELGISYQGLLLLDYRPGGRAVHENAANVVALHLARLQRFCFRYFRFAQGSLEKIYLCGPPEYLARLHEDFQQHKQLSVRVLDLEKLAPTVRFTGRTPSSELAAAFGAALPGANETIVASPNLLESFKQNSRRPAWSTLVRMAWPIAAMLLVALGMLMAVEHARWQVLDLEADMKTVEPLQAKTRGMWLTLASSDGKRQQLEHISSQLCNPGWHQVLAKLGGALPADVWMDALKVDGDGRLDLNGISRRDESIFQLVERLKKLPELRNVALIGTRQGHAQGGQAVYFQLEAILVNPNESAPRSDRHD